MSLRINNTLLLTRGGDNPVTIYRVGKGWWTPMDPADQFNTPYSYVGNNPISLIDPTGKQAWLWGLGMKVVNAIDINLYAGAGVSVSVADVGVGIGFKQQQATANLVDGIKGVPGHDFGEAFIKIYPFKLKNEVTQIKQTTEYKEQFPYKTYTFQNEVKTSLEFNCLSIMKGEVGIVETARDKVFLDQVKEQSQFLMQM